MSYRVEKLVQARTAPLEERSAVDTGAENGGGGKGAENVKDYRDGKKSGKRCLRNKSKKRKKEKLKVVIGRMVRKSL